MFRAWTALAEDVSFVEEGQLRLCRKVLVIFDIWVFKEAKGCWTYH